jgi:hypothetical protein
MIKTTYKSYFLKTLSNNTLRFQINYIFSKKSLKLFKKCIFLKMVLEFLETKYLDVLRIFT